MCLMVSGLGIWDSSDKSRLGKATVDGERARRERERDRRRGRDTILNPTSPELPSALTVNPICQSPNPAPSTLDPKLYGTPSSGRSQAVGTLRLLPARCGFKALGL